MEVLTDAPKATNFIPLAEHQSVTPASFYQGPPVLHYYSDRCKLIVLEHDLSNAPALASLVSKASNSASVSEEHQTNGDGDNHARKVIEELDVWVTSEYVYNAVQYALPNILTLTYINCCNSKLFIFSNGLSTGLSISYPSISLHAIQSAPEPSALDASSQGLYMQLVSSNGDTTQSEDTEPDSISVTIIPTASLPPTATTDAVDAELESEARPEQTPVVAMFNALSACSNLHPDPVDEEDENMGMGMEMGEDDGLTGSTLYQAGMVMPGGMGGGLPPPMPGSGGWITAENMHEYFDAEGNWIGPEDDGVEVEEDTPLGPGAGTTRQRGVDGGDMDTEADGDGEETKWRRTE